MLCPSCLHNLSVRASPRANLKFGTPFVRRNVRTLSSPPTVFPDLSPNCLDICVWGRPGMADMSGQPHFLPIYGLGLARSGQSVHTGQVRGGPLGGCFCVRTVRLGIWGRFEECPWCCSKNIMSQLLIYRSYDQHSKCYVLVPNLQINDLHRQSNTSTFPEKHNTHT